jgi:Fe-S-cluster-containing hydrogenase component 2
VAADPAVIKATLEAIAIAADLGDSARRRGFGYGGRPWLMVSLNDGEDPHFRKAEFEATACPTNCPRPCESICPAGAIAFSDLQAGVIDELCYGCGRCIPVCPSNLIGARSYVFSPEAVAPLVFQTGVDAIEIHTQSDREADFRRLWHHIQPWIHQLKAIAISCPNSPDLIDYLRSLHQLITPLPSTTALIWQTDGRPMSGDIGSGTTRASIQLSQKVLSAQLPGYVQLAGGTNDYTVAKLRSLKLLPDEGTEKNSTSPKVAGVAYGSYARTLLSPILESLESPNQESDPLEMSKITQLETQPDLLWKAVNLASSLVSQIKGF